MDTCLSLPHANTHQRSRLVDGFGREITYLRLSVTDRCNLRCFYCMRDDVTFLPRSEVLSLEELARLAAAFVRLGVTKLRLTGGEPLARPGIAGLIERLGGLIGRTGLAELTLTTNGTLLAGLADALAGSGVRRVNVSLDTLDALTFRRITGGDGLGTVLAGIAAAQAAGLSVRVNMVAMSGINDSEFDKVIRWCGEHGCDLALIEVMPLGLAADHYLPLDMVQARMAHRWTLKALADDSGGPARWWHVGETGRRLGLITPMSHAFCGSCNRVRVTCAGRLVPCLGHAGGVELRPALRQSEADWRLEGEIAAAIAAKPAAHRFSRGATLVRPMWQMGG
jgi:cyclic pyranopterin phosphate synthase